MVALESTIILRAKQGDRQAFSELVELYKDKLFNAAYRMVGNRAEAEDIVQETFFRAYKNLSHYDASRKFSTWVYRIATNLSIDSLRKRRGELSFDAEKDSGAMDEGSDLYGIVPSSELGPEDVMLHNEASEEIQRAIERLPLLYRAVVVLKYMHDMPLGEIAQILNVPVSTVKTRLHRAREALRKHLSLRSIF